MEGKIFSQSSKTKLVSGKQTAPFVIAWGIIEIINLVLGTRSFGRIYPLTILYVHSFQIQKSINGNEVVWYAYKRTRPSAIMHKIVCIYPTLHSSDVINPLPMIYIKQPTQSVSMTAQAFNYINHYIDGKCWYFRFSNDDKQANVILCWGNFLINRICLFVRENRTMVFLYIHISFAVVWKNTSAVLTL